MKKEGAVVSDIKSALLAASTPVSLQLSLPKEDENSAYLFSNRRLRQAAALIATGDCLDGGALYTYLSSRSSRKVSDFLGTSSAAADAAGVALLEWYNRVYSVPTSLTDQSWQADRLEYEFAASVPNSNRTHTVLNAEGYHQGRLDWYSFDIDTNTSAHPSGLKPTYTQARAVEESSFTVIPTETRFAGMPKSRWWEFEDGRVNLNRSSVEGINPAELIFNEFSLIFSNDWMILPYTQALGNMIEVEKIIMTDVFGQRFEVKAAGSDSDEDYLRWDMFSLKQTGDSISGPDYRLLLPQVLDRIQEGKPFETVNFIRDEMANMVWAVEKKIPDGLGSGTEGYEAGLHVLRQLKSLGEEPSSKPLENDARLKYQLGTTVPENWIPFIPVHAPNSSREIRLQRSSMPRIIEGLGNARVLPRTGLLSQPKSPYYINEEEIPRAGAIVSRSWQRTRWFNGKTYTWVGRRKQTGRGEGSSGLKFDQVEGV